MSKDLYAIWENIDRDSFYLEENNLKYDKDYINDFIKKFKLNLNSICSWENRKVYLDINDRKLFIICFLTLLNLKAKIVLVPSEIKQEDYIYNGGLFLSNNKISDNGIFIDNNYNIKPGDNFDPQNIEEPLLNDNTVIYLYTSGSTGKAKLIPKTSSNLLTEINELKNNFKIDKDAVFYFTAPIYHIYGILFDLLLPLLASAKIIIDYHFTPETIAEFVNKKSVTHFISIPSYYRMFCELNLLDYFKKCKIFFSSSAPLPLDVSKAFYEKQLKIIEVYGSTETGGIAYRMSAESQEWKMFGYVRIIDNDPSYLESNKTGPKTVEFKIVSPAISIEYNPDLGFNTGDIVDLYPDNKFILLGRNTRFEKISGKRVDLHYVLEKIREYMQKHLNKEIKEESLFIGVKDQKIYVISENNFPKTTHEMKDDLKQHLPGYALPRLFIHSIIPRNNMGKINKIKIDEIVTDKFTK